jgi:NAD+ kinase
MSNSEPESNNKTPLIVVSSQETASSNVNHSTTTANSSDDDSSTIDSHTSTTVVPKKKSTRKRKASLDDIRVPEKLEAKKRKLLNSITSETVALDGNGIMCTSQNDSSAMLLDSLSNLVNANSQNTPSPSTPISTPVTNPAYHYSSKNVDTTHIYVRSSNNNDSTKVNHHTAVWEHDEEEADNNAHSFEQLANSSSSVAVNGSLDEVSPTTPVNNIINMNDTAVSTEERVKAIQNRLKNNANMKDLVPPSPTVGKVGIQLVKQINTQYVFEKFKDANIRNPIMSPGSIELHWDRRPERVLVVKQLHTDRTDKQFEEVVHYLVNEKKVNVYVEPKVLEKLQWPFLRTFSEDLTRDTSSPNQNQPATSEEASGGYRNLHRVIDLIICLGGDGTILHTASMFPSAVPPILGFNLGSLGFLTAFDIQRYKEYINHVFNGSVYLSTRMRLTCKIRRQNGTIEPYRYQVLNDIVVDRGQCPFLCNLECYCNNSKITTVQADGLILATPTGSTAYSMSAGGSIVHPNVNCLLLTPICPHSLSFRPIILPDSTILTIKVPQESRGTAWVGFDGKNRQELQRGDSVIVTTSIWPVPLICKTEETSEWFMDLTDIFNWNKRERQKSFSHDDYDSSSSDE